MSHRAPAGSLGLRVLALALLASTATAQTPGEVLSDQKISDTAGGFTGGLADSDSFGRSVLNIGDLDGDGNVDVAVGAIDDTDGGVVPRGAVWILFLDSDGTVKSDQKISSTAGGFTGPIDFGDLFGHGLAALGDLDGDGNEDIAVGAPNDDDGGTNRGAVWILFLDSDGTVKSEQKISDTTGGFGGTLDNQDLFGVDVDAMGDVDGDGICDLAVGAQGDDDGGPNRGAVWILFLDTDGTVQSEQKISDTTGGFGGTLDDTDRFGRSVAALGDLDGDTKIDLAVGAPLDDDGGPPSNKGAVWILFLDTDGTVLSEQKVSETVGDFGGALSGEDRFGGSLGALGDLDADGIDDLAVGTRDAQGGAERGAIWILFMDTDGTVRGQQEISDTRGNFTATLDDDDLFGSGIDSLGDLDGDGDEDIIAGAIGDDDGGTDRGAAYVLFLDGGSPAVPVAEFSGTPTTGPANLTVAFTDETSGNVDTWAWDFGDGGMSSERDPSHTYTSVGMFTVTLTSTGLGGSDVETKVDYIDVTTPGPPTPDFTALPLSGDAPLAVNFQDTTTGNVTAWDWDFGDGGMSPAQNPNHVYNTPGMYTVVLTATGLGGSAAETKVDYIDVTTPPAPVAEFSGAPLTGAAPLTVTFTDATTGQVSSWSWDFGDGGMSSAQNPTHEYTVAGMYTVTLTATGLGGSDAEAKVDYVDVAVPGGPTAEFSGTPLSGDAPLTVNFTDLSTGSPTSWSWDFGDSGMSTAQNPSHQYASAGNYTITLTATSVGGSDLETKVDYVTVTDPPLAAEFSGTPLSGDAPLTVNFTDLSTGGPTSWSWDFGDSGMSTAQNPSHQYTAVGTYTVTLTVTDTGGSDLETKVDYVTVSEPPPVAEFSGTPLSGDAPLTVVFTDATTGDVTAWAWDLGDGGMSTAQNPSHEYAAAGTYTVALTATGAGGSDLESKVDYVTVTEPPPVAEFSGTPLSGDAPLTVAFTDATTGDVTAWAWDFGDGGMSTAQNPSHEYAAVGTYTVALTATGAGGSDLETKVDYVTVTEPPPAAEFSGTPLSGFTPLTVVFTDLTTGDVTAWAWDFGDGGMSTAQNPSHEYATSDDFTVTLTATGAGGSDVETKVDYVASIDPQPKAVFSSDKTGGLAPITVNFIDQSMGDITGWSWDFGDGGMSTAQNPSHLYAAAGNYTVTLTVTGALGSDVETLIDYIHPVDPRPIAEFIGFPRSGKIPLAVKFTGLTTGNEDTYSWDFGDGGTSTLRNPVNVYDDAGVYTVTLTVTGTGGSDTVIKEDYVAAVPVNIVVDGSFEDQTPGVPPGAPWTTFAGDEHLIHPLVASEDGAMPTSGSQWVELSAAGSTAAQPPATPGGEGAAPLDAMGLEQSFGFDPTRPYVAFDAAFLLDGNLADLAANDFMSVDVSDGTTSHNVFYRDSFSAFPNTSDAYGTKMTEVELVTADLSSLFPTADTSTVLTLRFSVGNGGNGQQPSKGYVDSVRFAPAAVALSRNGLETNPTCLVNTSAPALGGTWTVEVDSTAVSNPTFTAIQGMDSVLFPGVAIPEGELLVDIFAGNLMLYDLVVSSGGTDVFSRPVPADPSLEGFFVSVQAIVLGDTVALCNALDVTLGY